MNLYVTTAELKTYLGISGSSQDTVLAMLNKQATAWVNGYLSVNDLAIHKETDEVHDGKGQALYLHELHAVDIGTIMDDSTEYTQTDAYDIENYVLHLTGYLVSGFRKVTVDYAAGWNDSGMATITVTDYANIAAAATVTLGAVSSDGFTLTRGTSWVAGTSNETEAALLAAAIDAQSGTRAFAIGNVVYIVEATNPQVATRTLTTSDATRLAKSTATLGSVDFPEDIRAAVMMLVSSYMATRKNSRLKSYTIGTKTVSFGSDQEFQTFKQLLAPYLRSRVFAV